MKHIRSTYHTLHDLKAADPKLRKATIAKCNQNTLKSMCKCALNVVHGNIPLSACTKRKLKNYKNRVRKVADMSISLRQSKVYRSWGGFLLPLLSVILPAIAGLIFRSR